MCGGHLKTPESIKAHSADYKDQAWKDYTVQELGMFVHLFVKRAKHRLNLDKKAKDLYDAQNYLNMMQKHIDDGRIELHEAGYVEL
jgi:hypothetical protein